MQLEYNSSTRHLCVIGDPIAHSLSPTIYNTLFKHYKINALYTALRVAKGALPQFLPAVSMLDLVGFNVTMPHKNDLLPYLDKLGESALLHGSVNTVVVIDGKLCGHSTDAAGFLLSLEENGIDIAAQDVLLLGAGGAAAAIALQAAHDGVRSLTILNRDKAKAEALAQSIHEQTGKQCTAAALDAATLARYAPTCSLLINGTPLGMEGCSAQFDSFDFLDKIPRSAALCDLIYKPAVTALMAAAQKRNIKTIGGIGMLIGQAFVAFEHYYGILPGAAQKALVEKAIREAGYAF